MRAKPPHPDVSVNPLISLITPPPQPRLNSSSDEIGLNDDRILTVRRFPNQENGPGPVSRRQSTPEQGNKAENSSPDYLSASVSSPGLLSHASDPGQPRRASQSVPSRQSWPLNEQVFCFYKLSLSPIGKVRAAWRPPLAASPPAPFTAASRLPTDNDSDEDVNGGGPSAPPNRQHRKEKKEFPVSPRLPRGLSA